jgi:hypothetical protein
MKKTVIVEMTGDEAKTVRLFLETFNSKEIGERQEAYGWDINAEPIIALRDAL